MSSKPVSNSRALALIGLFSALYIVTAGIVSSITGPGLAGMLLSGGYPEHVLRGLFMAGVVISTRKMWSATMMGIVSGLVFVLTVPAPGSALYLFPSTVAAGLVYDFTLKFGSDYAQAAVSRRKVLVGAGISGVAESVVALAILTFIVRYTFALLAYGVPLWAYWAIDAPLNAALSIAGASIAVGYLLRKKTRERPIESSPISRESGPS
jgi:hypothetical protein